MRGQVLWAVVVGFLLGVLARSFLPLGIFVVVGSSLVAIALLALSFFLSAKNSRAAFSVAIACIAFGGGLLRMESAIITADPLLDDSIGRGVVLEGVVVDEPDVREKSVRVSLQVHALIAGATSSPIDAGVLAVAPSHTKIAYGDVVRVGGTLRFPESFDAGLGRVFNYPAYLAKDGITYQLGSAQFEALGENRGDILKKAAIGLKHLYLTGLANALPEPESALAGGITVGEKRSIGEDLSEVFRRVSLIHIIVLSGYNITIVLNALARLIVWAPRYTQFAISGAVIAFFVLMTGGAASAVRAGAMATLAMYARISGRMYFAIRALAVVAACMVVWNPYTLAFDPGFQLSAIATLGLIVFTPIFASRLRFLTERFAIREIVASTLGTQLAVLPLLLYQSGQLSLVALPANLLALIPIPFAMFFSLVAAIAGVLLGPLAILVGFPAYLLLAYVISVAEVLSSLPFASIALPAFGAWWMFVAYGVLFVAATYFTRLSVREGTDGQRFAA